MDTTTILIIDDEKAILESLAAHLDDCGYRTLTARNGREGLEIFDRGNADLVLVDLRMPEVDGLEVLARIKRSSPETPMIAVSGTGVIQDAIDALHQGAWDYVLKPIEDFSVLMHSVDNCLERARLQRENREYQLGLERMVAERTAELEQANTHLCQINDRLRRIVDTTKSLAFCTELDGFGELLLEEFGEHMLAAGGSLYIVGDDGLHLLHSLDPGHATAFIPFPLTKGSVFQEAMENGQPILIRDISQHADLIKSGWDGYSNSSVLVFPLPDESGRTAGLLTLHSKAPPPFVEQDREIGMILASYSCEALRAVRASEKLRESEKRFREILDAIQTGIMVADVATSEILYVNPTAAQMYGAPVEAIVGRNCCEVLYPPEKGCCEIIHCGQDLQLAESRFRTINGKEIPVLRSVTKTVVQGRHCLLESFTDLSGQKKAEGEKAQLESRLRQAQKMESLGTLAGGIAHDFNNILSAVLGYAELGLHTMEDDTHPLHAKLSAIYHAGQRAKDLVGQILAFSRMQEKEHAPLKVGPIIKEAVKLLRSSLPADIEVRCHIRTDRTIMADATEIHQVVMNLCTNAYHAMEGTGGVLEVSLEEVNLIHPPTSPGVDLPMGEYVRMTVSDTGCGISEADINRIFEPYFTTKTKAKGTGLGLAVVHGIVKSHLGTLTVESQLGKGTRFVVYLPVATQGEKAKTESSRSLPRGNEKVLLVDDEEALVEVVQEMLEELGYQVTAVPSAAPALETFRRSPYHFDLVITDLSMPGLSGVQMAQEMNQIRPETPIILYTGFSEWLEQGRGEAVGIRQVLMKPITMEDLAVAVRKVLEN